MRSFANSSPPDEASAHSRDTESNSPGAGTEHDRDESDGTRANDPTAVQVSEPEPNRRPDWERPLRRTVPAGMPLRAPHFGAGGQDERSVPVWTHRFGSGSDT